MGATDRDTPPAVDDVVRDVLGELANMIGGNLKCILNHGTRLSMPSVVDGDYTLRVCGAASQERLAFSCDEGVFRVSVLTTGE
jgi:CheY-specific phosphatase CheX